MGIELARAYVTVRADSSGLGPDLDRTKGEVEAKLREIQAGAAAMLGMFASKATSILRSGLADAEFMETTQVEMETMLGSAKETQDVLAKLTQFAAATPFEMPQLISLTRDLITFGERGDEIFKTLKMLGDASGGSAQKFGMVGLVFNQIRGAGKLLTQDFRQLSTRGVISLKDVAEYYKTTTAKAQEMMSAGKISFNDFRKILEKLTSEGGRFANGMEKQSKTMQGLRSTMNDSLNIAKRFIAEPLVPHIKSFYSAVIEVTNALLPMIKAGGEALSFAVVGAASFATLGAAFYGAGIMARFFGMTLKGMILGGMRIALPILAIGAAIGALVSYFDVPKRLGAAFSWLRERLFGNEAVANNLRVAWERIRDTAGIVAAAIMKVFAPFATLTGNTWNDVIKFFEKFLDRMLVNISNFAMETAEWIQAIATHWKQVWDNLPHFAAAGFLVLADVFSNVMAMMLDMARDTVRDLVRMFIQGIMEINIATAKLTLMAQGKSLPKAAENMMRAAGKKQADFMAKNMDIGLGKNSGITDPFKLSERTKKFMKNSPIWDDLLDIFKTKKELEKKRKPTEVPGKPGAGSGEQAPITPMVKAGIYEIPAFGKKFQEAMLKGGEGGMEQNMAKMVGIAEMQKAEQEKTTKAIQDLNLGLT